MNENEQDQIREVLHTFSRPLGKVRVSLERNSRGMTFSIDVDRPRQEGESFEDAAGAALALAKLTYERAELAFPRPEGGS